MKVDIFGWVRDALEENGIKIKSIERDNTCGHFDLDFFEHDKVFEYKIAKLEKDIASYKQAFEYKCADYDFVSELLGKYQQENEELKQRIAELEDKGTESVVEVKTYATPIEIATHLINNTCTINELNMIAEHLLIYCKHYKKEVNND